MREMRNDQTVIPGSKSRVRIGFLVSVIMKRARAASPGGDTTELSYHVLIVNDRFPDFLLNLTEEKTGRFGREINFSHSSLTVHSKFRKVLCDLLTR